jgi:hypothetical protein
LTILGNCTGFKISMKGSGVLIVLACAQRLKEAIARVSAAV